MVTTDFPQFFDGVINLLTAFGVFAYIIIMNFSKNKNSLQKRLILILTLVATLCFTRGLKYMFDFELSLNLERVVLVISALIPLSLFLLFELMLRRHFPFLLKLYAVFSTFTLCFIYTFCDITTPSVILLMADYVIMMGIFSIMLMTRKRADLTSDENKLLDTIFIISVLIIPLIVSDFRTVLKWDTIRLGAFGILFFIYSLMNIWNSKSFKTNAINVFQLFLLNLASAVLIAYVFNLTHLISYVFVLIVTLRMLIHILTTAAESYSKRSQMILVSILDAFSDSKLTWEDIKEKMKNEDLTLVSKKDLKHYRPEKISSFFKGSGIFFRNEIDTLALSAKTDADIVDEIKHIYADFDCNACIYIEFLSANNEKEFFILLFKWPALAPRTKLTSEIKIISNMSSHLKGY
jgi:hypothetical protein